MAIQKINISFRAIILNALPWLLLAKVSYWLLSHPYQKDLPHFLACFMFVFMLGSVLWVVSNIYRHGFNWPVLLIGKSRKAIGAAILIKLTIIIVVYLYAYFTK